MVLVGAFYSPSAIIQCRSSFKLKQWNNLNSVSKYILWQNYQLPTDPLQQPFHFEVQLCAQQFDTDVGDMRLGNLNACICHGSGAAAYVRVLYGPNLNQYLLDHPHWQLWNIQVPETCTCTTLDENGQHRQNSRDDEPWWPPPLASHNSTVMATSSNSESIRVFFSIFWLLFTGFQRRRRSTTTTTPAARKPATTLNRRIIIIFDDSHHHSSHHNTTQWQYQPGWHELSVVVIVVAAFATIIPSSYLLLTLGLNYVVFYLNSSCWVKLWPSESSFQTQGSPRTGLIWTF